MEQHVRQEFMHQMKWFAITAVGIILYGYGIWLVAGRFPPPV